MDMKAFCPLPLCRWTLQWTHWMAPRLSHRCAAQIAHVWALCPSWGPSSLECHRQPYLGALLHSEHQLQLRDNAALSCASPEIEQCHACCLELACAHNALHFAGPERRSLRHCSRRAGGALRPWTVHVHGEACRCGLPSHHVSEPLGMCLLLFWLWHGC